MYVCMFMCVLSSGSIFVIETRSARDTEKKERSLRKSCSSPKQYKPWLALLSYVSWYPNKHAYLCNASLQLCTWFNVAVWIFFFPLAVFFWIFTHDVAAGQMQRTVKNQQSELPFPKCQAYNLQNGEVTKKQWPKKKKDRNKKKCVKERW